MTGLLVQKYGGMCLETPQRVREVAAKVAEQHRAGRPVIAIVSAMGKTTDELIRLAYEVSPEPNRRELDMLLTTGERVSMSLLSMALRDLGVQSISLTGSQAGVLTDSAHSNAKIIDVRPTRLSEELKKGQVVVLAGFQGVDPQSKEITTLGRGGSDTTAVAIAAALKAEACEIIKEVDGLCSGDPKIVANPLVFPEMSYDALLEMSFWGAKILHYRSVELAQAMNVPLSLRFYQNHDRGTIVRSEVSMFENQKVLAVNSQQEIHHFEVPDVNGMDAGWKAFSGLLQRAKLPWPQILAATIEGKTLRSMYTSDPEHLAALRRAIEGQTQIRIHRPALSSVTLTCHGAVATDLLAKATQALADVKIEVLKSVVSPLSISLMIEPSQRAEAVKQLHAKFIA